MRRSDDSKGPVTIFLTQHFGRSHIDHYQIAFFIDNSVLRLQISVNDILRMQVFYRQNQTTDVKGCHLLVQKSNLSQNIEEVFSFDQSQ